MRVTQAVISITANGVDFCETINREVWALNGIDKIKVVAVSRIYNDTQSGEYRAVARVETTLPEADIIKAVALTETKAESDLILYEKTESVGERAEELLHSPLTLSAMLSLWSDKKYKKRLREIGEDDIKIVSDGLYLPL